MEYNTMQQCERYGFMDGMMCARRVLDDLLFTARKDGLISAEASYTIGLKFDRNWQRIVNAWTPDYSADRTED